MRILGLGLLSLDVLYERGEEKVRFPTAGGTMGNVLTILSTLGWTATPIATIGDDYAGRSVSKDLQSFGVKNEYIELDPAIETPIWVEYLDRQVTDGRPSHFYSRTCPLCRARLPSFTPPSTQLLNRAAHTSADVIFADRVSVDIVKWTAEAKRSGATIMYEPGAVPVINDLMQTMISLADILKYADDSFDTFGNVILPNGTIAIHTRGAAGLRFRVAPHNWISQIPAPVEKVVDVAGCGDWLTAGALHALFAQRKARSPSERMRYLDEALRRGQILAAWNCAYVGARGGMYHRDFDVIAGTRGVANRDDANRAHRQVDIDIESRSICSGCRIS
ncbi:MAG TPA: PfkB family carbohydrate kinase [Thermoanaerobaculia bacterium]|jgi:sugar/nucleoside kinase (ribokinase family)|nr:PfkB family carbohydrate kinase [Thermoanaerobaculia bacterium]